MPRRTSVPRYSLHKATGQARARYQGRDICFGVYNTPESRERYARFAAELASQPATVDSASTVAIGDPDLTVSELILFFLRYANDYYGPDSSEPISLRSALKPVNELYGSSRVRDFGPRALKSVREHMVDHQKLSRKEINRRIGNIKWAVSEELIPPSIFHGLQTVV